MAEPALTTAGKEQAASEETSTTTLPEPPAPAVVVSAVPAGSTQELTAEPAMPARAFHPFGWSRRDLRRAIALALAGIVALVFLWRVQSILPPFLISFFLAALLDPTIRHMERHGRSRMYAIVTLYIAGLCLVLLIAIFIVPLVKSQLDDISGNLNGYVTGITAATDTFIRDHKGTFQSLGIQQQHISELLSQKSGLITGRITTALGGLALFLSGAASYALWLIIIPISTFFFMRDYPLLRARIIALFPESYHDEVDVMSREILDIFSAYLRGLAKICALYGCVAVVVFWLLGVRYALFLGLMAGVFYAVPYVGQLFTAIGVGTVAFLMEKHNALFFIPVGTHSPGYALAAVACSVMLQIVFDQIVYPRVVGASVGLHPVISIFALMAGATLFGVWGMLMAVPVAASIQIILTFFFPRLTQSPPAHLMEAPAPLA